MSTSEIFGKDEEEKTKKIPSTLQQLKLKANKCKNLRKRFLNAKIKREQE
jgi:hypothetical protein